MGCCFPKYMKDPDNIFNEVCKVFLKLPNIKNVVHVTSTLIDTCNCTCLCIFFFIHINLLELKKEQVNKEIEDFFPNSMLTTIYRPCNFFYTDMSQLIII